MPTISSIAVYPIKALDPVSRRRVSITDIGGLAGDRIYGVVDTDGEYVNGKRTADVYRLDATVHLDTDRVELRVHGEDVASEFHLEDDRAALEAWLSEYFGTAVELEAGVGGGQTDSVVYGDGTNAGPTVVSAATVREVASWFDDISPEEMCLRLRPNLVVDGVPPFWEDGLVAGGGRDFRVGEVTLEGVTSVPRCAVPEHDPHTGERHEDFRTTFVRKREETLPGWIDPAVLDGNLFSLTVVARIPESERSGELAVGDQIQLMGAPIDG